MYPCNPDSAQWAQKAHQVTTLAKVSIQHPVQCAVCSAVYTLYCPDCAAPSLLQGAVYSNIQLRDGEIIKRLNGIIHSSQMKTRHLYFLAQFLMSSGRI